MRKILFVLLLAGCAAQKSMTLYPRGAAAPGQGIVNMNEKTLAVTIGPATYQGSLVWETLSNANNKASSVLLGPAGQLRCDITFSPMFIEATGLCVDAQGQTYDVIVK